MFDEVCVGQIGCRVAQTGKVLLLQMLDAIAEALLANTSKLLLSHFHAENICC